MHVMGGGRGDVDNRQFCMRPYVPREYTRSVIITVTPCADRDCSVREEAVRSGNCTCFNGAYMRTWRADVSCTRYFAIKTLRHACGTACQIVFTCWTRSPARVRRTRSTEIGLLGERNEPWNIRDIHWSICRLLFPNILSN